MEEINIYDISEMVGKTPTEIKQSYDTLIFKMDNGEYYKFYHAQDCCESVSIDDVIGDLEDLEGHPLLLAEEVSNLPEPKTEKDYVESCTWTFYKFSSIKGSVTVRWYGESNGYYSESVDCVKYQNND